MAGHEANPAYAGEVIDHAQQLSEAHRFLQALAIGIDVLTQEREFDIALSNQLADFLQNGLGGSGLFPAADIGHDAVGTEIVAAVHDRDVGFVVKLTLGGQPFGYQRILIGHPHDARMVGQHRIQQRGQLVQVMGAKCQIDKRILL
ncbi:hypothetical protein SDC9_197241 [bioreactor metagenome]|uniref:Uncharacterized protein n=1 Tax=bioreactor metagenome TaxID=1076179 RepID=A0A645IGM8_9ZZZZ